MSIRGWVYVISNPAMPGLVKVGFSTKDPALRARELDSAGFPHPFEVEVDFLVDNPRDVEQKAHKHLSDYREGKEWFRCDVDVAVKAIRTCAANIHVSSRPVNESLATSRVATSSSGEKKLILPPLRKCNTCSSYLAVKPWRKLYCWKCMGLDSTTGLIARNKEWCNERSAKYGYTPQVQDPSEPDYNINRKLGEMGSCGGCGNPLRVVADAVVENCSYCQTGKLSDYQIWAKTPIK